MNRYHPDVRFRTEADLLQGVMAYVMELNLWNDNMPKKLFEIEVLGYLHIEIRLTGAEFNQFLRDRLRSTFFDDLDALSVTFVSSTCIQIKILSEDFGSLKIRQSKLYTRFDETLETVEKLLTPEHKIDIERFLVKIGYLKPLVSNSDFDFQRDFDLEYNPIVLALGQFIGEDREFLSFARYVWAKKTGESMYGYSFEDMELILKEKMVWFNDEFDE